MQRLTLALVAGVLLCSVAAQATAAWPTTKWTVREQATQEQRRWEGFQYVKDLYYHPLPTGQRGEMAAKHKRILEAASQWYQGLDLPAPYQVHEGDFSLERLDNVDGKDYFAVLKTDADSISSSHNSTNATMQLSSHAGFLQPVTPRDKLMEYSAVHELYHAVQSAHDAYRRYADSGPPGPQGCDVKARADQWLTEGTAAYVQIRWLERLKGITYGHPFKGSPRAAWVRYFDQPLDWGSLPAPYKNHPKRAESEVIANPVSWYCSYGSWYFWYAMGEMLARPDDNRFNHIDYLKYIFAQAGPWQGTGVAMVDAGLREAAAQRDVIDPYRDGLYDLYPQFVAQYLDNGQFYQHVEEVELATPGLYETASTADAEDKTGANRQGALQPLASRAWRVRVQLPEQAVATPLYTVRFTLAAQAGTNRDDLHLIVDREVAGRPAKADTAYTLERRAVGQSSGKSVEYLLRIANVARDVTVMQPANYTLKIEVEGYYDEVGKQAAGQVAGELPPGFDIQGPSNDWRCDGDENTRAQFALVSTDAKADALQNMVPEAQQSMRNQLDSVMVKLQRMQQTGALQAMNKQLLDSGELDTAVSVTDIRQAKEQALAAMQHHQPQLAQRADAAAATVRQRRMTSLRITLVGAHGGNECQMLVHAQWPGNVAEGGRVVSADGGEKQGFGIRVMPAQVLQMMRQPMQAAQSSLSKIQGQRWRPCQEMRGECAGLQCNAGQLVLEQATKNHASGSFNFDVVKLPQDWPHGNALCRDVAVVAGVSGHFNVATSIEDTGTLLDALISGRKAIRVPGAPILGGD